MLSTSINKLSLQNPAKIAMAPSERAIIDAIQTTVRRMFYGPDRDELSVNNVRAQVEKELKLGSGFLKDGAWKQKAKDTIKAESVRLQ